MRLRWCFIATQNIFHRKAVGQADSVQRDVRQLAGVARENAQAITATRQFTHQFHGTRRGFRTQRQVSFVLQ
ncbi:hypothetical protein D3C80_2123250 [compost metagenome]